MADPLATGPIPDTPPSNAGATPGAVAGIAALKKACLAEGIDSNYAICALLGIAGVESKWLYTSEENMKYSFEGLMNGPFKPMPEEEARKWCKPHKKGYTPVQFFGWLYGTRKPNGTPADGNYFGRGYIQLTTKANYKAVGEILKIDLVNEPEKVISDMDMGAKIAVAFLKMNIPNWKQEQYLPSFFEKLKRVVKGDPAGWNLKRQYYEYFLGGKSAAAPTDKDPTSTAVNKTAREIETASPNKREAYSEDRSANFSTVGFTDPEGKYPLRDYMNEPDTNRLARGIIDGTSVNFKDSSRITGIPVANGGSYDQPQSAYNTIYPFNKVFESESGHVLEFDDSPDGERVNLYHKKGTFIEIDPNGSQINYIVGDGFYLTENNGNIFINGTCNITSAGPMNILCQGDANIEVAGQVDAVFHNNVNMGVANDLCLAVGGDYNVLVEGNYNLEVGKTSNTRSIGTMSIESTDALKLKTAKTMSMEGGDTASTAETLMKMSSSFKLETPADFQIKAKSFTLDIEDATHIKTGSFKTQTTSGKLELKVASELDIIATGDILLDTPHFDVNGTPVSISSIDSLSPLGAPKVPVNFAGDAIEGRGQEQVLVDTVLNPAGEYNPLTISMNVLQPLLGGVDSILQSFGIDIGTATAANIYDPQYANVPIETKTSLSAAGKASSHRLVVPTEDTAHKYGNENLVPPERHSDSISKYENEEDWNTPEGQKAWNKISTTSDYEHNNVVPDIPTDPEETIKGTGGSSATSTLSTEKLADINGKEDFPLNYPLSKHFTLGMLVVGTNKFKAQKVGSTFYTKQMIVVNLCELCENILEPIWNEFGPCRGGGQGATWYLAEGFRSQATEGASATSHHLAGRAADIHLIPDTKDAIFDAAVKIEKIVPYQEFFMEYARGGASHWIHISYDRNNKSKELQTWVQHSKRSNGLVKLYSGNTK